MLKPAKNSESILGYTLTERIGAGGYGEVWAAEAPGGLRKAIKLIFGFHDENRAQRELKSLNRIKEVRHPFLLSLERIDVVDGRLVVVTELAEKSLNDRFNECVRAGGTGIPRDELLIYISDAADALDYISDCHRLQHLDIKPENLLLVGGHVKVADFGLVKDIHDGTQSLMSGLTPSYAPPELFDGRPNRQSDQYSLAIVFQEMLTGHRPFTGQTAAQLATQHLHGTPDLSELPPADRGVIKRALAKSPDARFGNCRAFVEELRRLRRNRPSREARKRRVPESTGEATVGTLTLSSSEMSKAFIQLEEKKLPPVRPGSPSFRPSLFIGIGETATNVVAALRTRVRHRLGLNSQSPGLGFICLDTDVKMLERSTRGASDEGLEYHEVLPIPLRSSTEYRDRKGLKLDWLSRRWIYNVPRSLQTESLRPLGRLAFVDHAPAIYKKFEDSLRETIAETAVAEMAEAIGLAPEAQQVEIFIITSISGGVGSGCVTDAAYAMRTVLAEQGVEATINGVLLSSVGRSSTRRDVTVANTFCCLSEINHFTLNGFPGDEACQLPPFEEEAPFDETYFVDLGTDPLPDEYQTAAEEISEYLYLNALTPCGSYFDACRVTDAEGAVDFNLRTLGIGRAAGDDVTQLSANVLSSRLLNEWLEGDCDEDGHDVFNHRRYVADKLPELGLSKDRIMQHLQKQLTERLGRPVEAFVAQELQPVIADSVALADGDNSQLLNLVESKVDRVLGLETVSTEAKFEACVKNIIEVAVEEQSKYVSDQVVEATMSCLDHHGSRLAQTEVVQQVFAERISQVNQAIKDKTEDLRSRLSEVEESLRNPKLNEDGSEREVTRDDLEERIHGYGALRLAEFVLTYAQRFVSGVQARAEAMADPIREIRANLTHLADEYKSRYSDHERLASIGESDPTSIVRSALLRFVSNDMVQTAKKLDHQLQRSFFSSFDGFHKLVNEFRGNWIDKVAAAVSRESQLVIAAHICGADFDTLLSEAGLNGPQLHRWAKEMSELAVPHVLARNGGASRLVIATPKGTPSARIQSLFAKYDDLQDQPCVISSTCGDVLFCYEVGMMPTVNVAAQLLHSCPEAGELVPRIHSRTDVDWSNLLKF